MEIINPRSWLPLYFYWYRLISQLVVLRFCHLFPVILLLFILWASSAAAGWLLCCCVGVCKEHTKCHTAGWRGRLLMGEKWYSGQPHSCCVFLEINYRGQRGIKLTGKLFYSYFTLLLLLPSWIASITCRREEEEGEYKTVMETLQLKSNCPKFFSKLSKIGLLTWRPHSWWIFETFRSRRI